MSNYAMDAATGFGDIPFVDFTKGLIDGVFDALTEAHLEQIESYTAMVEALGTTLSDYINNTADGVDFEQIADFISGYTLPSLGDDQLDAIIGHLENPTGDSVHTVPTDESPMSESDTWWGALINALGPAVTALVDKLPDADAGTDLSAHEAGLNAVLAYDQMTAAKIPSYQNIYDAVAALLVSNKYTLLQTLVTKGMMRLVVTEGLVETRLTFSTFESSTSRQETSARQRFVRRQRQVRASGPLKSLKTRQRKVSRQRQVAVNTAKSFQQDTSGTQVSVFGRVQIKFKTDYAPLGS